VYALLYSMVRLYPGLAERFQEEVRVSLELKELPFSCLRVVKRLGCDISEVWDRETIEYGWNEYIRLVVNMLIDGVNCAELEFPECGEDVKKWYREDFGRRVRDASVRA